MAPDPKTPAEQPSNPFGSDEREIDAPTLPGSIALLEFWRAKVAASGAMRRGDFPAREIAALLPWLIVYEPVDGGSDCVLRLIGTGLVERYGADFTGRRLGELMTPESFKTAMARLTAVTETQMPRFTSGRLIGLDRDFIVFEIVVLPLLAPDGVGKWVLGGMFLKG